MIEYEKKIGRSDSRVILVDNKVLKGRQNRLERSGTERKKVGYCLLVTLIMDILGVSVR
jgi:hypothetical protein